MIDPYNILGVPKDATMEEIKKAYRKLAKKLHPDLNPGKQSEQGFKNLANAYDLIGTEEARARYDRGDTDEQKQKQYEESTRRQNRTRQGPFYYNTQQDTGRYSSAFGRDFNASDTEDLFSHLFGGQGRDMYGRDRGDQDEIYQLEIEFKEAALGHEKIITLPSGKKLQVKIPAGIEEGKKLKFPGHGKQGVGQGPPGDAYIQISVKPLAGFKREGKDILTDLPISLFEAILGSEIETPTVDGSIMLKIPAGVSSGTKLRIKEKGAGTGKDRGNQIVSLNVVLPKEIDPRLRESLLKLSKDFSYNPMIAK